MVQGSKSDNPHWQWYVPQAAPTPEQGQTPGGMDPYTAMFLQQMMGGMPQFQGPPVDTSQNTGVAGGETQTQLLQAIMQLLQQQNAAPRGPVAPNFNIY